MMRTILASLSISAALLSGAGAVTVNLFPLDRGWFDSNDQSLGTTDDSYIAGEAGTEAQWQGAGGREFRNFFVFDLSAIGAGTILSGKLKLLNPLVDEGLLGDPPGDNDPIIGNGFFSNDASETYEVTSYTLPGATTLTDLVDGNPGLGIYANLGTGASSYGSVPVTVLDSPSTKEVSLTPAFVTDANAAAGVGRLVIGGRITTLDGDLTDTEVAFAWTDLDPANYTPNDGKVVLTLELIPEPSSLGLLGLGAALCFLRRRRE